MSEVFSGLIQKLQQACDSKDWEKLKSLDLEIKESLIHAISIAKSQQEKARLAEGLKGVQRIYQLVIEDSVKHQAEISSELKKMSRDKRAANSYLGVSQF